MLLANAAIAVAALCAPPSRPVIAEVYYDAAGDDSGREFVELLNRDDVERPLEGARLEAGDGSAPGRWTLRWTGGPAHVVPARGRFVIGGALVTPAVDAVASLDLQNGPDAVRLVWPDGATEILGYGRHEFAEYACGEPAVDAAGGQSLARVPDGADRGANALDFQPAEPSPGRPNQPSRDVALVRGSLALAPAEPVPDGPATLAGAIVNRGVAPALAAEIGLVVRTLAGGTEATLASGPIALDDATGLAPGDTATWRVALTVPGGKQALIVDARLEGDEAAWNDTDTLRVRSGGGPLGLSEIQFHPAHGEGEWVEVVNRTGADLDLTAFTLSDRGAARGRPVDGEGPLPPGALAVLAQDRGALLARRPALDPRRVWNVRPWASLNNGAGPDGIADEVVLREEDGTTSERHAWGGGAAPNGVPIERREGGDWWPSLTPEGTPLESYRPPPPIAGHVRLAPRRLAAGTAAARLAWALPWPRAVMDVDLYDLAGARAARVVERSAVPDRGERDVDLSALPPGLYVLVLQAREPGGAGALRATDTVRIEGGAR
jgi:hypothetical protein